MMKCFEYISENEYVGLNRNVYNNNNNNLKYSVSLLDAWKLLKKAEMSITKKPVVNFKTDRSKQITTNSHVLLIDCATY